MGMRIPRLTWAVCAAALGACSAGGETWTGTARDSAGIQLVENTDQGIWTSSSQWTLEEETRIGTVEGDSQYQFGQIGLIAVDSHGQIYVIDGLARNVRVFTPAGEYVRTIGGPGEGPGELGQQAVAMYMGPGDTLLVPDMAQQRVNRYAPDGTSLGSFPLRLENGIPMNIAATRTGVIAEQVRPLTLPDMPARDSMDAILSLATDGTILDTLMRFPSGGSIDLANRNDPRVTVFAAEPVWDLAEDGRLLFGINDNYRISVYQPDGRLERIFSKPFTRSPVTEGDQEKIMGYIEKQIRQLVPPAQVSVALQRVRAIYRFADFYPAFAGVTDGPQGTMWVQHIQSPSTVPEGEDWNPLEDAGAPDWDVFDSNGRYLGVVSMPARFQPRMIRDDKIYGVWRDELDVQYVARMRIVGIPGERG